MVASNMMSPFEHQGKYNGKTLEFSTSKGLPEETNHWFPNWRELFPGLLATQKQKTNQIYDIDASDHRKGIVYSQPQKSAAIAQGSNTQRLYLHPEHANISIIPACSLQQTQQVHAHTVQNTQALVPIPVQSQNGTPLLSHQDANNLKPTQETNRAPSPIQATSIIVYTIKSPRWLPQGWVTELHIRRPDTTSSTCNKYFKHVASGRRFRLRKDVLHFTNTGKVRAKKISVRKKDLRYTISNSPLDTPANRKLCIMESHESSTQNLPESKLVYGPTLLTLELSEPDPNTTLALPCKQRNSSYANGSVHPPEKEPAIERAHNVSVTDNNVTPKSNDKQTFNLWQPPVTKPAMLEGSQPLNPTTFTAVSFHQTDVEIPNGATDRAATRTLKDLMLKKRPAHQVVQLTKEIQAFHNEAIQMVADTRSVKNSKLHDPKADRATQLRKEINAAHNEVVQISRVMQAAAEKLSTEILVAKRNAEMGYNMQASDLPTGISVEQEDGSESSKSCKPNFDTLSKVLTTSSMGNPVCRLCEVKNTPPAPLPRCESRCTSFCLNDVIEISQLPIQPVAFTSSQLPKIHLNALPNTNIHPVLQLAKTAHASIKTATKIGKNSHTKEFDDGKQSGKTGPKGPSLMHAIPAAGIAHQTERPTITRFYATEPASLRCEPTFPIRQPSQIISMPLPSITRTANETTSSDNDIAQPVNNFTDKVHVKIKHDHMRTNDMKYTDRNDDDDDAEVSERQTQWKHHPSEIPCTWKGEATLPHGLLAHVSDFGKTVGAEEPSILTVETQDSTNGRRSLKWQQMEAMKSKFSAVLNPKLDLSGLSPSLTTRQRGKEVEKMKARHARELLASLGKRLCREALRTNALPV